MTLCVYPLVLGGCWVCAGCFLGVVGGVLILSGELGSVVFLSLGAGCCYPVLLAWWAQLDPFTASSGGLAGPKQVGRPLRWSLWGSPGASCLRRPVLCLRGLLPACMGSHACPAFSLGVFFFFQTQAVYFLERAAQGQCWGCCSAAPQILAALASPPSICGGLPAGPWLLLPSSHTSVCKPLNVCAVFHLFEAGGQTRILFLCLGRKPWSHSFPAFSRSVS